MKGYVIKVEGEGELGSVPELAKGEWYLAGSIQDSMHLTSSISKAQVFATDKEAKLEKAVRGSWSRLAGHQLNKYTIEEIDTNG